MENKKQLEEALTTYYYLVKHFGFENTIGAFLQWKEKFYSNNDYIL